MKILLVTCRYPWPARRGDQMRAVQFLRALRGHEVCLLTPAATDGGMEPPEGVRVETYDPGSGSLGALGSALSGGPLQSGIFLSSDLKKKAARLSRDADVVVLQLVRLAGLLKVVEAPVYVDLIDALSLNFATRSRLDRPWLRPVLAEEARRLQRQEARVVEAASGCCVVCLRDRDALEEHSGIATDVVRLPMATQASEKPLAERPTVAFTGNLGYFVNADAAGWWARRVWPHLRDALPEARFVIAGDRASRALRRRASQSGVELVPSPRRLLDVIESAHVSIAPMRCGAGVPVKVLEAWACATPVVASAHAAAGVAGHDGRDLLVCESVDDWVESVRRCLTDSDLVERLTTSAAARLEADYSEASIADQIRRRIEEIARSA